jgi:hypothetical protein
LLRWEVVDVSENKERAERHFILVGFQADQPASRNAINLVAPFLREVETLLFNVT